MFRKIYGSCLGVISLLIIITLMGCAKKISSSDPIYILNKGNYYYAKGSYTESERRYQKILNEYPDSPYRADALIGLADSLFYQGEYGSAALSYRDFYNLYPVHPNVVKSYFYRGMSYFIECKTFDRDQTNTLKAIEEFEKITNNKRFRQSIFYDNALKNIEECKRLLAQNIFRIGKYYFDIGAYGPTITRMEQLIREYPNEVYQDEAVYLIAESYFFKDNYKVSLEYYKLLRSEYPDSLFLPLSDKRIAEIEAEGDRLISKGNAITN